MIRISIPNIDQEDIDSIIETVKTGFLVQGKKVQEFESIMSEYIGVKHAIAVTNCTAALHLSLLALGAEKNDIVFVPTYSWLSTANVVELIGARPIFIDIDEESFNMNPEILEKKIKSLSKSEKNKVKAILPVHVFGNPNNILEISKIAKKNNIKMVEDAACALGAKVDNKMAGSIGDLSCFSFHPRKAITTGEGGIIATNNQKYANVLKALRNHGLNPESPKPDFILAGYNCRLTEFQAAFGISQMKKFNTILKLRNEKANYYNKLFSSTNIITPNPNPNLQHAFQTYTIVLPKKINRDKVMQELKKENIEVNFGTYNMPSTKFFKKKYGYNPKDYPVTHDLSSRIIALPLHDFLKNEEQDFISQKVLKQIK